MSLFPTKFVADVGILQIASSDTLDASLTVNGTVVLNERYSPANGIITVRGLRNVLEAAVYGELGSTQDHAAAIVVLTVGELSFTPPGGYLFASRLRNPRDPNGQNTIMAAGDLVAVSGPNGFITPPTYTYISGTTVQVQALGSGTDGQMLVDGLKLWIDHTACPEKAVAVRFLNRYDVPQTMMTTEPLQIKPGFQDQTALMNGHKVRFSVSQNDEYTLRSGVIHSEEEYASWSDLVTSRKAEILMSEQWLPIVITKSNYTMARRSMGRNRVEITFNMADPRQGL